MQTERNEIMRMMESVKTARKPCLRRSNEPDSLFATDLPLATDFEGILFFRTIAGERGWTVFWKSDPESGQ